MHAPKLLPLLHWFQNCFCFCSTTFPSHVGTFLDYNGDINGKMATPTCRFSNVQFLHCKIAQDKNILASRILKSHLIFFKSQLQPGCIRVNLDDAGEEQSRNYFWFYCNCPWNTIIVFVLVSWCDRRAALSETIKAL